MRAREPSAKAAAEFIAAVEAAIVGAGATRNPCEWGYRWHLQTRAGLLELSVCRDLYGWLHSRFDDVDAACACLGVPRGGPRSPCTPLNPFSGKWNHPIGEDPAEAAATVARILVLVLHI